ncbi:hypothetical protein [Xenorhabdus sp. IM139775]|uniref:hypothetical protein n=1 Tax=Xenorhabdus sp. IM139775 TaxID=3025876 RepID=UPI00235907A9|nr:hypothetical protein [Xenorhabdus sp. IM139775]MDC9593500.1 hypothetical protein [Xenorhabdus sp. IM139775]
MSSIAVGENGKTSSVRFYDSEQNNGINGRYLVTIRDGELQGLESMSGRTVVDAEAYWRLRKDLTAAQKVISELSNRMRFIHDECSIGEFDYPIHEVATR